MATTAQGLDVSGFAGQFDWAAAVRASPGLAFGGYRLTSGLHDVSPDAGWNSAQIRAQRLYHAAFHLLDPGADGALQAQAFIAAHALQGLNVTDMLWLDTETAGSSAAATAACAVAFMRELDVLAPASPRGVLTFTDFMRYGYCDGLGGYPLWQLFPSAKSPYEPMPWMRWTMWSWGARDGSTPSIYNGSVARLTGWLGSFAPPAARASQEVRATGMKTMGQIAAEHQTTVPAIILETARQTGYEPFGIGQSHLISQLENDRPPPGTELWIP